MISALLSLFCAHVAPVASSFSAALVADVFSSALHQEQTETHFLSKGGLGYLQAKKNRQLLHLD